MSSDDGGHSGGMPAANAGEPDAMIGQVIDRYRITAKLGEGGMGEVYAAKHIHINKRVALKLLRSEVLTNQEAVDRFTQEAHSASSIGHKNIIKIEDFGKLPDGRIFLAMELLDGEALNDMIQQPVDPARLLQILIQTGHGLAAAHAKQIIHRDMKPENVFITTGDVPKLLDFGIAKVSQGEGENHLTRTGTIFGTPFYMAPEQALGQSVDHRVDIYAMGVIIYEIFCGAVPFQGESFMGILTQHITAEPPAPEKTAAEHGRSIPGGITEIIGRCMAKDPNQRYGSMDELVAALVEVYRGLVGPGMSSYMHAQNIPMQSGPHAATMAAGLPGLSHSQPVALPGMGHGTPTPQPGYPPMQPVGSGVTPGLNAMTPVPHQAGTLALDPQTAQSQAMSSYQVQHASASSSLPMQKPRSKAGIVVLVLLALAAVGGGVGYMVYASSQQTVAATGDAAVQAAEDNGDDTTAVADTKDAAAVAAAKLDAAAELAAGDVADAAVAAALSPDAAPVVMPANKKTKVLVTSSPDGAAIYLGKAKLGKTPKTIEVKPGSVLVLKRKRYNDLELKVDGSSDKVKGTMVRKKVATPPPDDGKTSLAKRCKDDRSTPECVRWFCNKNPNAPLCALE